MKGMYAIAPAVILVGAGFLGSLLGYKNSTKISKEDVIRDPDKYSLNASYPDKRNTNNGSLVDFYDKRDAVKKINEAISDGFVSEKELFGLAGIIGYRPHQYGEGFSYFSRPHQYGEGFSYFRPSISTEENNKDADFEKMREVVENCRSAVVEQKNWLINNPFTIA